LTADRWVAWATRQVIRLGLELPELRQMALKGSEEAIKVTELGIWIFGEGIWEKMDQLLD